ncbi:Metastasis-associated protein MTA2 [Dissostichus eleginoides]|uniref:Metastasis-associated protein MTA2 n=1 Tax=Dissostichus eleginoides TaxID=100907 RepID=A0AAD9F1U7_DISEL|nr:Metastasis-associated protein MTA2 [Dissostichus eleginoides]
MAANMYRVGDYVYFENSSSNPYLIRRIEELNKTANGNVEAKVVCLFRRRDISGNLNTLADSNAREFEEESKQPTPSEQQKHQLKHRELFLSRQFESLPATHIRGKCNVTLLNETDVLAGYLDKEDCFFYSLVFDPNQKTLLADQGEIRVGSKYQAEIPDKLAEGEADTRIQEKLETKVWDTNNLLKDPQIDQSWWWRAVGTFARALDCSSSIRQPSLHMSAAAASRDITLFHAMDTLQKSSYDLAKAMSTLVPQGGPVLCRDEMEEWSASEAMLFEEALEKYGKDFNDIRQDFLPWKSLANYRPLHPTETTKGSRSRQQAEAGVHPHLHQAQPKPDHGFQKGLSCESCHTAQSPQWYAWGPPNMQCRLCASCWIYWKKYGGLKTPTQLEGAARTGSETGPRGHMTRQEVQGLSPFTRNEGRAKLLAKNRQTFILQTTKLTRIARRVCEDILQPRRAARRPYASINANAVKAECITRLPKATKTPVKTKVIPRPSLANIVKDLAITAPLKLKASRGPPTPINRNQASTPRVGQSLLGKRGFESAAGVPYPANGRPYTSGMRTTSQSVIKRQKVSQGEAPNPVVFVATKDTRALRKHLTQSEMRRAARKPHLMVRIKLPPPPRSLVMPLLPSSTSEPIVLED